ncbi:hypothetical protein E1B28_003784 [Marasmius oreades]|uniref:Uncharacterized protein n=1 Tax=Marasmius oreades TaxID=181124 RepID=A0A9P7UX97_9AGAR|nr:uncharacterized protein E1B28_003784 [Marasmius oreades]KAG7096340.1 hypothetical protein E1B28_003784 [Marasmius oreades]
MISKGIPSSKSSWGTTSAKRQIEPTLSPHHPLGPVLICVYGNSHKTVNGADLKLAQKRAKGPGPGVYGGYIWQTVY